MCVSTQSRSSLYTESASCIGPLKHQGAPLLPKMFSFFCFGVWPKVMKTWMIISFNAVPCHPLYVKISQTMWREYRTVSCELKAYGASEEMNAFREHDSRWRETQTNVLHQFFHLNHTLQHYPKKAITDHFNPGRNPWVVHGNVKPFLEKFCPYLSNTVSM